MTTVSWRGDKQIEETATMLPIYLWLYPWVVAAQSARAMMAAFTPAPSSAEVIPFPESRIRRRVAAG